PSPNSQPESLVGYPDSMGKRSPICNHSDCIKGTDKLNKGKAHPPRTRRSPMKTAIVIPARFASTRLPGKPLLKQTGKYLVQHVYERACQARKADLVIVATDDPRIAAAVASFGGRVMLTRRDHPSGTDRVAEVARGLQAEVVVNLQGDEPLVEPATLDLLIDRLESDP